MTGIKWFAPLENRSVRYVYVSSMSSTDLSSLHSLIVNYLKQKLFYIKEHHYQLLRSDKSLANILIKKD